jgi:hypothetical protein
MKDLHPFMTPARNKPDRPGDREVGPSGGRYEMIYAMNDGPYMEM